MKTNFLDPMRHYHWISRKMTASEQATIERRASSSLLYWPYNTAFFIVILCRYRSVANINSYIRKLVRSYMRQRYYTNVQYILVHQSWCLLQVYIRQSWAQCSQVTDKSRALYTLSVFVFAYFHALQPSCILNPLKNSNYKPLFKVQWPYFKVREQRYMN